MTTNEILAECGNNRELIEKIRPGVLLLDGSTYYPTKLEWLRVYSLAGFEWAIAAYAKALTDLYYGTV